MKKLFNNANAKILLINNQAPFMKQKSLKYMLVSTIIILLNSYSANADDEFSVGLSLSKNNIKNNYILYVDDSLKLDFGYSLNKVFSLELSYYIVDDLDFDLLT